MKKNTNIEIKKIICILIVTILFLIVTDLIDITQYIPLSKNYDWLGICNAIIGGILGAIATLIGVYKTINYEKERDKKQELENRKNNYYSYLTFSKQPIKITISLDSITNISNIKNQNILIGKNVEITSPNYFDIELNFNMLNNIFPSSVALNKLTINYGDKNSYNEINFDSSESFYKYSKGYNKITIKNERTVAFVSRCLINNRTKDKLSEDLKQSKHIDIITDISFLNPSKIVTKGIFNVNLEISNIEKIGDPKNLGSNKLEITYNSTNTYFLIEDIYHVSEKTKITR